MEINELCVIPATLWPYIAFGGSWGNVNSHYSFDLIFPQFGRPHLIGGLLDIFCSCGLLGLM